MAGLHTTCEGWVEDGRTTLHVRGGEGMGGVAGAVHVIPPSCDHSSKESGARDRGINVLPYRIHLPFLQESHIWDE